MIFRVIFFIAFLACTIFAQQNYAQVDYSSGVTALKGQVFDSETNEPLPARLVLTDQNGNSIGSYYNKYPGHFTNEDGTFSLQAEPGRYELAVYHGINYLSQKIAVELKENQIGEINIQLEPWVPLRQLGWVNGDGHAHLYTDIKQNEDMLRTVRKICRAQGVDFLATNQGWAGYGDDDWRAGYAPFSDDTFMLTYGAEMPKYRTGHTWWLGLESTYGYFSASMDSSYENQYYKVEANPHWDFDLVPFNNIPDVYLVPRLKKAENAVACIPHPTSWWWEKRGEVKKYTTNVCEYLSFSLLAGKLWDGFVVMGYNADHYFYQNLWFHILNEGYKMPALAELDGGYGENNKFPYGLYRVYYFVGDAMNMDTIVDAVRQGRTFVTSGPIVFAEIDQHFQIGDEIKADGAEHALNIEAYASGNVDDYLSFIIVFRNGKIFKLWDVREDKARHLKKSLTINENEKAWYVVKVYGRDAQSKIENLDVMQVCDSIARGEFSDALNPEANVALTSPFYFVDKNSSPEPLVSHINLKLIDPDSKKSVAAQVEISVDGELLTRLDVDGHAEFDMPVNALLKISADGYPTIHRGLYLDYEPHEKMIETFANGDWLYQNNWKNILVPGQVPWEAFQFERTKEILSNVDWTIELKENERDVLWDDFEMLFQ